MWKKRVYGQLAKCTEAQALRKAWPEVGQEPTAEEMEGKYFTSERDVTPSDEVPTLKSDEFRTSVYTKGIKAIESGKKTAKQIIAFAKTKGVELSAEQISTLQEIKVAA